MIARHLQRCSDELGGKGNVSVQGRDLLHARYISDSVQCANQQAGLEACRIVVLDVPDGP